MKHFFSSLFTALIILGIFTAAAGCKKDAKCEIWIYNRLVRDIQPGCSTVGSEYGIRSEICGDDLNDAHNHATVLQSKNSCFSWYIQYVKQAD